jgi:hypothetical protein
MQTEFCSTVTDFWHQSIDSWKKIGETNIRLTEKIFQAQAELAKSLLDVVSMQGEEISHTKDVKEIASLQAEMVQVSGKLIMESAQSTAEILKEATKDYNQLFETALKSGAEFAKPANSSKAKKAAA